METIEIETKTRKLHSNGHYYDNYEYRGLQKRLDYHRKKEEERLKH